MYYLGITAGTSPTTFSPDAALTRGQAAVFVSKGVNQAIARSSRRAALGQWWTTTPLWSEGLGVTTIPNSPGPPVSDGADIWVPDLDGIVSRVRASDGRGEYVVGRVATISPVEARTPRAGRDARRFPSASKTEQT